MHAKRRWLDIGATSIKNLRVVSNRRKIIWLTLLLTSLPIHLLLVQSLHIRMVTLNWLTRNRYNSVVFSSLDITQYLTMVASDQLDFAMANFGKDYGSCWEANTKKELSSFLAHIEQGKLRNLSSHQYIDEYTKKYVPGRGTLVLLVDYNDMYSLDSIFWNGVITPSSAFSSGDYSGCGPLMEAN